MAGQKYDPSISYSPAEAIQLQQELRSQVRIEHLDERIIHLIGGVDVGFPGRGTLARAAVVILEYPSLCRAGQAVAEVQATFPYIPGLLAFREIPAILAALEQLDGLPDVFMVDGQGLAHPRRIGIACHLGVVVDRPSLGCAKSLLVGRFGTLPETAGSVSDLLDRGEVVGRVVRTRQGVKPVFISVGHRIDLDDAVRLVLACTTRYRLPEPTRQAHQLASTKPTNLIAPLVLDENPK